MSKIDNIVDTLIKSDQYTEGVVAIATLIKTISLGFNVSTEDVLHDVVTILEPQIKAEQLYKKDLECEN